MTLLSFENAHAKFKIVVSLLLSVAITACGGGSNNQIGDSANNDSATAPDSSTLDSSGGMDGSSQDVIEAAVVVDVVHPDVPMVTPADHEAFTVIPDQGGPRLAHPQLVIITYPNDTNRASIEAYANWIVGSNWLTTVGAEYGVGAGSVLGIVQRTDTPPRAITSDTIEQFLSAGIADGSLPSPTDGDFSNTLYMVFYPASTSITMTDQQGGSLSCHAFGGYHSEVDVATPFSYAVIPNCANFTPGLTSWQSEQVAISHEIIEAATDALPLTNPAFQLDQQGLSPWLLVGGEVGDLCAFTDDQWHEAGFVATRVWSNMIATTMPSGDPCNPNSPDELYFGVTTTPDNIQLVNAGDTVTFTVKAWAAEAIGTWLVSPQSQGSFQPTLTMDQTSLGNGDTTTLHVTIPVGTPRGSLSSIFLFSQRTQRDFRISVAGVFVQ